MAKHKSATQVTVQTEEKSGFELWILRNWPKGVLIGVVIAAGILFMKSRSDASEASRGEEWNALLLPDGDLQDFQAAAQKLAGTPIEGWAHLQTARMALVEGNVEAAKESAQALASASGHMLNTLELPIGKDGANATLGSLLSDRLARQASWESENKDVLYNPEPPADAPRVTLVTDKGEIEVALYSDKAPKHAENFLKLAKEDYYDGTKFHRVVNNFSMRMIQGGDPNTIAGEPATWGQGGPDYSIEQEENGLKHDAGYLSAAKPPTDDDSSGSQFFITFGRSHHLDGQHTVFGKVVSGMDVVREIGNAPLQPYDPQTRTMDRPEEPVVLTDVRVN